MAEALSTPVGVSLWLDIAFGLLLAISLIITAELLAWYVAKPSQVTRSQPRQDPAPSGVGLTRAELVS